MLGNHQCIHNSARSLNKASSDSKPRAPCKWWSEGRGGVAVQVPFGRVHITCKCRSVVSCRDSEWLTRNLLQGRLFSLHQTLYHLSSITSLSLHLRWHGRVLFSHGHSYRAFYFGRTFKGNLGWLSMPFFSKINTSGWKKLADCLTAHRLETQSAHERAKSIWLWVEFDPLYKQRLWND